MKKILFSCVLLSIFILSYAQNCSTHSFTNDNEYNTCSGLTAVNSFLHWTYHEPNHTVDVAYRRTGVSPTQWVAWALNIDKSGMVGAQTLVALTNTTTGLVHAYTSPVKGYETKLEPGALSFNVSMISAEYTNNQNGSQMIIYATLELPKGRTSFNQVWQAGPVTGDVPRPHDNDTASLDSVGTVDFGSGRTSSGSGGGVGKSRRRKENVHGVLNVVSWGILMPLGVIAARYFKSPDSDSEWFFLHIACQISAYVVGVAGWATGIHLGSNTKSNPHRGISIALFCLGTLQVLVALLRPSRYNRCRPFWNIYHYVIGYIILTLTIVNIFEGFDILQPEKKWKIAYIAVLSFLGFNATVKIASDIYGSLSN